MSTTIVDPEFEATARAAFVAVFGQPGIEQLRELAIEAGSFKLGMALYDLGNRLELSSNDRRIFRVVAEQLLMEAGE